MIGGLAMLDLRHRKNGRKLRVCIYGSTDAEPGLEQFIERLTCTILKELPAILISGGVKLNKKVKRDKKSVDWATLEGARLFVEKKRDVSLKACFEAWVPDPSWSTRPHIVRMTEDDGVTVKVMEQRSDLGRRLRLIRDIDLLVTVRGKVHTETVLEQALETDTPALPLWFAGGDSTKFWNRYRDQIQSWFPALTDHQVSQFERFQLESAVGEHERMIKMIIDILASARVSRCLALLPFDDEHNDFYDQELKPIIERQMIAVRLDRQPVSQSIDRNFQNALDNCRAIVADVTQPNLSVMYEIGYAHAKGISPFLFRRQPLSQGKLPVYVTSRNVAVIDENKDLSDLILNYLLGA